MARISIQEQDFDAAAEARALCEGRRDIGALVSFIGLCRDEGGQLGALELEHYPGMAEEELTRLAAQAQQRWHLQGLTIIHRYGKIQPGEQIVLVIAASGHRGEAFAAADFLMDYLKSRAPFWKKEHLKNGTSGDWVDARDADEQSLKRWE